MGEVGSATSAARTVGGLTLPVPVSGHAALELCNTRAAWREPSPREYLTSYAHAVALAVDLELLAPDDAARVTDQAAADPAEAERALARLLRLRTDLYRVLTAPADTMAPGAPPPDAAVRRLDAAMLAARRRYRFAGLDGADGAAGPVWVPTVDLRAPVDAFARSAEELLRSPQGGAVRACPGPGCGWLFTDLTRRRRWCSMQWCGNRAKARRHAARARPAS